MNKVFMDGLSFALPLLIMAIGALYSEKSGVTNLAIEGFQGVGAFFGALAFARYDWRGRRLFQKVILLPIFFPQPVLGLALL